jgi:NTP pyrophosphatase (non-canonical NTP hydrolase)
MINRITNYDLIRFDSEKSLDEYQEIAIKSAIFPGRGEPLGLMYCALKLNGEAGELAEHVGKAMRDDAFGPEPLTTARRELIIKELGDVLWYLSAIADCLGIKLGDVGYTNLQKLKDRTDRDAIRGSGDER